jgi:hypothetical protein
MPGEPMTGFSKGPIAIFAIGGGVSRPLLNRLKAHFAGGGDCDSARGLRKKFQLTGSPNA